jgi:hypothetical protein
VNTQLSDLDFWTEALYKEHKDLIAERLSDNYSCWKDAILPTFLYDSYMKYASYYAVVVSYQDVFLSPVMGVLDNLEAKKRGYVCIHPYGIDDALRLIRKFVDDFIEKHDSFGHLFGDQQVIDYLNSSMSCFLHERFFEKRCQEEDERIDSLFNYGNWLTQIDFDSSGGYLTKECKLSWEYRIPVGTFDSFCQDLFGFIVIPREYMVKLLEDEGLFI